jgi:hypothetical protein
MGLAIQSTLQKSVGETGMISAEDNLLCGGRRISTLEGRITDRNGRLLAHGATAHLIFDA